MSRTMKTAAIAAGSALALLVLIVVAGILILRTAWFANLMRERIVTTVERAIGGKTEAPTLHFQWNHLRAEIDNFVIHGTEPAGAPPLLTARRVEIEFKLFSPFRGALDIAGLLVDTPRLNVMVFPNGTTNIPRPGHGASASQTIRDVVNLAIGRFQVIHGTANFADRPANFDARGENLRARFAYDPRHPGYAGELDMSPLVLQSGSGTPVDLNVKLPVVIGPDKIAVAGARLANRQSAVDISGQLNHLDAPRGWAHVRADVSMSDLGRAAGMKPARDMAAGPPHLHADIAADMDGRRVDIQSARLTLGESHLEARGTLIGPGSVRFDAGLALGQIAHWLKWPARPEGKATVKGNLKLKSMGAWVITASAEARDFDWVEDATRLRGLNLAAEVTADPQRIDVRGLRLAGTPFGPGGGFNGGARIEHLRAFRVAGDLRRVDLALMGRLFLGRRYDFGGMLSGPLELQGDLKNASALAARTTLDIAPGGPGVPVSGRLNASYSARADSIVLGPSRLQLPHTRIELAGSLDRGIQVRLVSRNLDDLRPLGTMPLQLVNGSATIDATVSGRLSAPRIQARAALANFDAGGRRFSSFSGDVAASKSSVAVTNALLTRGPLRAEFSAGIGLRDWKPAPNGPLRVDATVRNADVADVLALANQQFPASGLLAADIHLAGTLGSPTGSADISVTNGSIADEHFDSLTARAAMTPQAIELRTFSLAAGASRIDASADYRHAVNRLNQGALLVRVAGNQVQLADFQTLAAGQPGLAGTLTLNADFKADLRPSPAGTEVQIAGLDGNLSVMGLKMSGNKLGDFTAAVYTAGGALHYTAHSDFAGSMVRASGQTLLAGAHQTTASIQVTNLPMQPALELAGSDLPLRGLVSGSAQVSGTLADPRLGASFNAVNGAAWQQPFDRLQAGIAWSNALVEVTGFQVSLGPSTITASGSLSHPAGDYQHGRLRFRVDSNQIQLAGIRPLEQAEPGIAGTLQLAAEGDATLRPGALPLIGRLDGDVNARGLAIGNRPLGNLTASARTRAQETVFNLASDFAHANVRGSGRLELAGDYPLSAQLSFTNLTYSALRPFLGGPAAPLEAEADGSAGIGGPLERPAEMHGFLQVARLDVHSTPVGGRQPHVALELHNTTPVVVSLERSLLTIKSAQFTGPFAHLAVSGTVSLASPQTVNVRADGNVNLQALEAFSPDLYSSGQVTLAAAATGPLSRPAVNGRLQLSNASLSLADVPNGISRASGAIVFNGTEAIIQNLSGESGGGKVTVTGTLSYRGPQTEVRLTASADRVWVEYPQNITTEASARLTLVGTAGRSVLSGDVTILNVALHPQTDLGSLLTKAALRPGLSPEQPSGPLSGIELDVHIRTAPDAQFRTSPALNLQAEANLTLRGTPAYPGMLGRIVVTEGKVLFFGARYTLDQGTISFFDPNRINPNLNIDLETMVQGIDVTISVTGPVDRLNVSYHSDPPMQFSDLLALLTSSRPATTDPVLVAHTSPIPEQGLQQTGGSALFGAAVTQPVAGRLQRLFGVTTLQINPQIVGLNNTAQASVTLQQQIAPNITFTYIQDVAQSNPLAVQMQWDVNRRWSVVAQRDIYGFFDLDFYWKKRFH